MIGMLKGMVTVVKHVLRPIFTTDYPEETADLPDKERGRLLFLEERCIKCKQCERICPNGTISMEVSRNVNPDAGEEKLVLDEYNIHQGACLICDLCVEVCPTDTLSWATIFESPTVNREDMFFDKERLAKEIDAVPLDKIAESSNYDRESYVEDLREKREGGQ